MSSEAALSVHGISKRYRLGSGVAGYGRLSETLSATLRGRRRAPAEHLWALRDVSFDVAPGEVVGLIGRNGSGKSTLLKVLSRITRPTEGYADLRGRVGSLLEVGTGFHPELTGRENVFLAGAILGMTRAEVRSRFDQIVDFAEVGPFVDTPVKRFSSGMYVRLAFSVAAHLDPDVLLVDEVLAVGDAAFQRRSLGRMGEAAREGRTVVFVSHNMGAIERLCSRALLLSGGGLAADGAAKEVVGTYLSDVVGTATEPDLDDVPREGTGSGRITSLRVEGESGDRSRVRTGGPLRVSMRFEAGADERNVEAGFLIRDVYDRALMDVRSTHGASSGELRAGATYTFEGSVEALPLYPGEYRLGVFIAKTDGRSIDYVPEACRLVVEDDGSILHEGRLDPRFGQFFVPSRWNLREEA